VYSTVNRGEINQLSGYSYTEQGHCKDNYSGPCGI
jgi:hypothetical protein